jgi:UDP-N-acetylglucosamine/UDP-N-acetylgalactosamine diphosphorylase
MFQIGMPSKKSIFQIHIERILKIRILYSSINNGETILPQIPIYIMTSGINDQLIRNYFLEMSYFGYPKEDIYFFEQGLMPCMSLEGKLIIESENHFSMAPDGNGGLYNALKVSGAMNDISNRKIQHLHIYGIDNILTKSLDVSFIGTCIDNHAECGNKVVWRANKSEKVGVTANVDGKIAVLEYSEIPESLAGAADINGKLIYGAANICNHYISVKFLRDVVLPQLSSSYHLATKKIAYLDPITLQTITPTCNNGVKLEMFIFDIFPLANKWAVLDVLREEEFAPVKNEPGNKVDSPDTAREMISNQSIKWLNKIGATIINTGLCEISPLLSYGGEGLERYKGQTISLPCYLE